MEPFILFAGASIMLGGFFYFRSKSGEESAPHNQQAPTFNIPSLGSGESENISEQKSELVSVITPINNTFSEVSQCGVPSNWSYDTVLANGYAIRDLTTGTTFPHKLRAQGGLSEMDIICNLKALVQNALHPVAQKYGGYGMRINSGFRQGSGSSQHERGQAFDVQFSSFNHDDYWNAAQWLSRNLPFDQFILEYGGNMPWLHVSYNKNSNRNQVLTRVAKGDYRGGLIRVV